MINKNVCTYFIVRNFYTSWKNMNLLVVYVHIISKVYNLVGMYKNLIRKTIFIGLSFERTARRSMIINLILLSINPKLEDTLGNIFQLKYLSLEIGS